MYMPYSIAAMPQLTNAYEMTSTVTSISAAIP